MVGTYVRTVRYILELFLVGSDGLWGTAMVIVSEIPYCYVGTY